MKYFVLGAAVGLVVGLALGPTSETSCCDRVRGGVRGRLGPLAPFAEALGLVRRSPDLLDLFGVPS